MYTFESLAMEMVYRNIEEAFQKVDDIMYQIKQQTGRFPMWRDTAPDWAVDMFLKEVTI